LSRAATPPNAAPVAPIARHAKRNRPRHHNVLPGFGLAMGYTVLYLSLIVLIPLSALVTKTMTLTWARFVEVVTAPQAVASYRLTFFCALAGSAINAFFGFIVAWRRKDRFLSQTHCCYPESSRPGLGSRLRPAG